MSKKIKVTEEQLKSIFNEGLEDYEGIKDYFNYSQIKNLTDIHDDDELNAAADFEKEEEFRDNYSREIHNEIKNICNGKGPFKVYIDFNGLCKMLSDKFGFEYYDHNQKDFWSEYKFKDGKGYYLTISVHDQLPANPGMFWIDRIDLNPFEI